MAIYLPDTSALFLEVPKTGSKWLRSAIQNAGVKYEQIGPPEMGGHGTLPVHGRKYKFISCFVRNPLAWYRSYWAYRMQTGWRPALLIDRECQSYDFRHFIQNCASRLPGILGEVYDLYTGPVEDPIDFVGHQETLANDLVVALRLAGESFDEDALRATPRTNSSGAKPEYDGITRELILLSEYQVAKRFSYLASSDLDYIRDILERYPEDAPALCRFAIRTEVIHVILDEAKRLAGRSDAEVTRTRRARVLGNFALYFKSIRKKPDEAEALFRRAIEFDPDHPRTLGNFASFLETTRGLHDEAENLYRHAISVRPGHARNLGMFAVFMETARCDYAEAQSLYERAVSADPHHAQNLGNWALFLKNIRQDHMKASEVFAKAIAEDPDNSQNLANYALLLQTEDNRHDEAQELYERAVYLCPEDGRILANYGLFLANIRCDYSHAEEMFQRAAAALPHNEDIRAALKQILQIKWAMALTAE